MQTTSKKVLLLYDNPKLKSSCAVVFSLYDDNGDHGIRQANTTAQALTQCWHLGALHEAINMLHRAIWLTSYQPGGKVVAFTIDFITFFTL